MLFNSFSFLLFFPIVVAVYFIIPGKIRYFWLLSTSYFFYMSWNRKYVLLLIASTFITYLCGILIEREKRKFYRKQIMFLGVFINLGILVYFKYWNFFLESINDAFKVLNIEHRIIINNIILPVGISFYIFQALGYMFDVYKEDTPAEKNIFRYALFVSFFPQLVAGPIERSGHLLKQLREIPERKLWDWGRVKNGLVCMLYGLFLKMVIADRLAIMVDRIFENYFMYGTVILLMGAVSFSIQIFCDFAGYSIIAIGAAKVMGFELMQNFNTPYFAQSIQDFWRRWHISLSTWFRDYLFIPLGGNRCSKMKYYRNILITFLLSGLWHGANWTFLIWGGIHGLYQILGKILQPWKTRVNKLCTKTQSFSYKFGRVLVTFFLTTLAWIFFRAETVKDALCYIQRMLIKPDFWAFTDYTFFSQGLDYLEMYVLLVALLFLFFVEILQYLKKVSLATFLETQCLWFRWGIIFFMLISVIIYGYYGTDITDVQFIYFQF